MHSTKLPLRNIFMTSTITVAQTAYWKYVEDSETETAASIYSGCHKHVPFARFANRRQYYV